MQNKKKIIFISTFVIVLILSIGIYLWVNRATVTKTGEPTWYQSFNPFGTGQNINTDTGKNTDTSIVDENGNIVNTGLIQNSKFHQITDFAVAGASFFEEDRPIEQTVDVVQTSEQAPSIRYTERKNGHIYRMFLDTKIKEKVSNGTIPNIYEAIFAGTGKTVLYRYLSENNLINSFLSTIGAVAGEFLPQNISDVSISLNKEKLFYLTENSDGVTGTIETTSGSIKNIVFVHPFTEWISQWDNKENIYLTTKASSNVSGSIFILNPIKKTINKLFGGIEGLTTLVSPDGSSLLYSYTTNSGPKLGVFNIKEYKTTNLDIYGLAEKCVWASDNVNVYCGVPGIVEGSEYPDVWYQGLSSFDDFFNKINTSTLEKYTIADSREEVPIDATYLFLDKGENSLFFINKKDSTLWSLDLK